MISSQGEPLTTPLLGESAPFPLELVPGVVEIRTGVNRGTGVILSGGAGKAVLTAAHVVHGASPEGVEISLQAGPHGEIFRSIAWMLVHTNYQSQNVVNDLAILWLESPVPANVASFAVYRGSDEIGKKFWMAGYGITGLGTSGQNYELTPKSELLWGTNNFDALVQDLSDNLGDQSGWMVPGLDRLLADFDNGSYANDALSRFLNNRDSLPVDPTESMIAKGDSGGPAFIDMEVAGVASLVARVETAWVNPDVDDSVNSSFGEIGLWQRVSSNQQFIDQAIREFLQNDDAPNSPEQVDLEIKEGSGVGVSTVVFFFVQLTNPTNSSGPFEVSYRTRDGTAIAGEDYVAEQGVIIFYPGENSVNIPVRIIADFEPEGDEDFYLDLFNPVGGSFEGGVEVLTAGRLILDDDLYF